MGCAELIGKLEALPREKQAEVFEFVEFLSVRFGIPVGESIPHADWTDKEFSELSMSQSMRGMEEEAVTYTREDLRERWQ